MIECSSCQTWVHLTCAKVRRTQIPETWYCRYCRFSTAKSSKGGAKSRARKPELRTKQQQQQKAALILTKNKRRLWSSARPLDLPEVEDTVSPSLDSQSHQIFSQITFLKQASPAWLWNWYFYQPIQTHIRHNNITRLADINKHWTCDCWTNYIIKCIFQLYIKTRLETPRFGAEMLMALYLPETYIGIILSSVMSFIDVLSVVVCKKGGIQSRLRMWEGGTLYLSFINIYTITLCIYQRK